MPSTNITPSIPLPQQVQHAARAAISVLSSGVPRIQAWRSAFLALPFEHWRHRITAERDTVHEDISFNVDLPGTKMQLLIRTSTSVGLNGDHTHAMKGEVNYLLDGEAASLEELPPRISLDKFPVTLGEIARELRDRLIENRLFQKNFSEALESATNWQQTNQWGRGLLELALKNAPTALPLDGNEMFLLAESTLKRERGVSEEGDNYNLDEVICGQVFELTGAKVRAVRFSAPMYDRYGNGYPTEFLYFRVTESTSATPRCTEFLYDSEWGDEFERYKRLAGEVG